MKIATRMIAFAVLLVCRRYWLWQPLPSTLRVFSLDSALRPNPNTLQIEANDALKGATKLFQGQVLGAGKSGCVGARQPHLPTSLPSPLPAESVAVDEKTQTLYILDRYGRLYTAPVPSAGASAAPALEKIGYVGPGRPLGYHVHPKTGRLIICDSLKGLTEFDPATGRLEVLANADADGVPLRYTNDLDVSESSGKIYFSDSTAIPPAFNRAGFYDTMQSYVLTALQGGGTGRLLMHDPSTRSTEVLTSGVWFANGVALAADESFVLVAETPARRVLRRWLTGPKAGTTDTLIEGLPGYPDGITRAADGAFWVAIIFPTSPAIEALNKLGAGARWAASWLLQVIQVPVKPWGIVLKVDANGSVLRVLGDSDGSVISGVSGVAEVGGRMYMGHLSGNYVSYIDL